MNEPFFVAPAPGATAEVVAPRLGKRSLLDKAEDKRAEFHTADQCKKGQVDFEGMKAEKRFKATDDYDRYEELLAEHGPAPGWTEIREKMFPENIDAAREYVRKQPLHKALEKAFGFNFGGDWVEEFGVGREAFVKRAEAQAFSTYAILDHGTWHGKGEMGWFGMGHDEMDESIWLEQLITRIEGLPDDTLLTVVDCHI